ncbi:putative leader peptide [Actinomadura bangladeshensis]|uniref:putative leader peptide n=1 Tax=Actinomadura bangladeshensis TaxID=453573 RepID=UPI003B8A9562
MHSDPSLWTRPHVDLGRLASGLCRPGAHGGRIRRVTRGNPNHDDHHHRAVRQRRGGGAGGPLRRVAAARAAQPGGPLVRTPAPRR